METVTAATEGAAEALAEADADVVLKDAAENADDADTEADADAVLNDVAEDAADADIDADATAPTAAPSSPSGAEASGEKPSMCHPL